MKTQEIQNITAEHIFDHLTAFIKKMDRDEIVAVNENGGFIWFTWYGVPPDKISLNLALGSADDMARREFLDAGDCYVAYDADPDLLRDEDGELLSQDDDYIEDTRLMWLECADMRAYAVWSEIQSLMAQD